MAKRARKRLNITTNEQLQQQEKTSSDFQQTINQLINSTLSDNQSLTAQQYEQIICLRYGPLFVSTLHSLLGHIPSRFPNRSKFISQIINVRYPDIASHIDFQSLLNRVDQTTKDTYPPVDRDLLWDASLQSSKPYLVMVTPKVGNYCLIPTCLGHLHAPVQSVTNITVYTLEGPVPGMKCSFVCSKCFTSCYFRYY